MTPTAQIAAIRQRQIRAGGFSDGDLDYLLAIWDARESALRALVAQWKQEAADATEAYEPDAAERATVWADCANHLERLLESEQ